MKKYLFIFFTLSLALQGYSQTSTVRYFKDPWRIKEVKEKKAKFSETVTTDTNGTVTTEIKNLKTGELIQREAYKDDEQVGIWLHQNHGRTDTLDYDFKIVYSNGCRDNVKKNDPNDSSDQYTPPRLDSADVYNNLPFNLTYPPLAMELGITGKTVIVYTVNEEGVVENVCVRDGAHRLLDKEAVRAVRALKYSSPAIKNGKPIRVCVSLPVTFNLR